MNNFKRKFKVVLVSFMFIVNSLFVFAARSSGGNRSSGGGTGNFISTIGRTFNGIINNQWSVYALSVLIYYLAFFAIFKAGISRLNIFEGEGGAGLNKSGKLFCHALTGMAILALFAFKDPRSSSPFKLFGVFGIYGQIILMIIIFMLTRRLLSR